MCLTSIAFAQKPSFKGVKGQVVLMTLNPGHFHAALVQKSMYDQISPKVYVYAPKGADVDEHLSKIDAYNHRKISPTNWDTQTYLGPDFFERMLTEKPGNVMMVAGKNSKKIDYISGAIQAGINVFADKPLVINEKGFLKLEKTFALAKKDKLVIYDIMTERFEVTTALQRQLSTLKSVFGELKNGTINEPAITKESVHHFFKYVSGLPIKRPSWFFDIDEEGEGIVDVTTHLVDLVQWEAFPNQIINKSDIKMVAAKHWATELSLPDFEKVTQLKTFPENLNKYLKNDKLAVLSNGEMVYKIKGKFAKVSVIWNFEAPEGTGDTHYSIMHGTKADLIIRQGIEEKYKPTLYIKNISNDENFEKNLLSVIEKDVSKTLEETKLIKLADNYWRVDIAEKYKIGHEEHFAEVTKNYLHYLKTGLPAWEVPNIITKYYTTIEAYKMANKIK